MRLKNISKINTLGLCIMGMGLLFISVVLNASEEQFTFLYGTYFIAALAAYGLGYSEIANTVKLGFGVTRYQIFKDFTLSLFFMNIMLLFIALFLSVLLYLANDLESFLSLFDYRVIIYLSLIIFFLGQVGMFFGNIRMSKAMNVILVLILVSTMFLLIFYQNKFIINSFLIISTIILIIVNYLLIKNIKLEINL